MLKMVFILKILKLKNKYFFKVYFINVEKELS